MTLNMTNDRTQAFLHALSNAVQEKAQRLVEKQTNLFREKLQAEIDSVIANISITTLQDPHRSMGGTIQFVFPEINTACEPKSPL